MEEGGSRTEANGNEGVSWWWLLEVSGEGARREKRWLSCGRVLFLSVSKGWLIFDGRQTRSSMHHPIQYHTT
jgi:hypothetical protein